MISIGSPGSYSGPTENSTLDLELELPRAERLDIDGETSYILDVPEYRQLLLVYASYRALADRQMVLLGMSSLQRTRATYALSLLDKCEVEMEELAADNVILSEELRMVMQAQRKERIRTVFLVAGAGVVGVAAGIITGILVTR